MSRAGNRPLGDTGISVAPLVIGGSVFGWTADTPTSFALLDAFVEAGITCIDTADVYTRLEGGPGGDSERVIGEWLAARGPAMRQRVTLITKCGMEMGEGMKGLSRRYLHQAIDASLRRLRTDYVDIYMAHRDDPDTPLDETLRAYGELIAAGKVRAAAASNYSASRLREALAVGERVGTRYQALETRYNLHDRNPYESEIEPVCVSEGLGVLTYFSLGSGFLTGKYSADGALDSNRRALWLKAYFTARGEVVLRALRQVAAETSATPAQVAIAWILGRESVTAAIVSATSLAQVGDLLGAVRLRLSAAQLRVLQAASRPVPEAS